MTTTEPIAVTKISNQLLLFLGLFATVLVGIGEWLLHFLPDGPGGEIAMLNHIPLDRAARGHFLAIYAAPLYFAGYYGIMRIFSSSSYWLSRALLVVGIYAFAIGAVWIGSRYFGADVLQKSANTTDYSYYLQSYEIHYQSIVWSLRICIILISLIYVILIIKNKIGFPKWMAIMNPAVLLGIIISSLFWAKPLGIHLAPIAMNAAHFIFFTIILYHYQRISNTNL